MVPKERGANVRWRRELDRSLKGNLKLQASVREKCAKDILFWMNAFCVTYDPRVGQKILPMVTYLYQDTGMLEIQRAIHQGKDLLIEKTRDIGASWMCLFAFCHFFQFVPNTAFALVSRVEPLVDKMGDPDCLFWKLDCILKHQPSWLTPKVHRNKLHVENLENGSVIDGYSTTGNVLRGGRKTAALLDEFAAFEVADGFAANAATNSATNCRIFNSTYQGMAGAFYSQAQRSDIIKLRMHWTDHPEKARGLWYDETARARSPWYDEQCKRLVLESVIAQELDINPVGAGNPFFPTELIARLIEQEARPPYMKGRIVGDVEPEFQEDAKGDLLLWSYLVKGRMDGDFVVGADVSAGTGATNSVLSIADRRTGEKIGELANAHLSPDRFADLAVATCRFFNDAYLIWEMNGPGGTFGSRVVSIGYSNIYYRTNEQSRSQKVSDTPGWHASADNKERLLRQYGMVLTNGAFINRSTDALNECLHYVYGKDGRPTNTRQQAPEMDRSGAKENHGDRVIADALAAKAVREWVRSEKPVEPKILPGCLAWHRKQETEKKLAAAWW